MKLKLSMWLPILWSGKSPKVFPMSECDFPYNEMAFFFYNENGLWSLYCYTVHPGDAYMHQWIGSSLLQLIHWGRVIYASVNLPSLVQIMAWHLNRCWNIDDLTLGNKIQWNINRNSYIFIQRYAFEYVICEMVAILSWHQCVNGLFPVRCQAIT